MPRRRNSQQPDHKDGSQPRSLGILHRVPSSTKGSVLFCPLIVSSGFFPAVGLVTAAAVLTDPLDGRLQAGLIRDPGLSRLGILFEFARTSIEIGFVLPDDRKSGGLALL